MTKVSDRALVARCVTATRAAGHSGIAPYELRRTMQVGRARCDAVLAAAIARGLVERRPDGRIVALPPQSFGFNTAHAIVDAGRLATETRRVLRRMAEQQHEEQVYQ